MKKKLILAIMLLSLSVYSSIYYTQDFTYIADNDGDNDGEIELHGDNDGDNDGEIELHGDNIII